MNGRKKRSGITLREEVFMKKLLAVALSLCLLCSFALAEEEIPTLNWADVEDQTKESGSFQQIAIPDVATLLYWVPNNMTAFDVNQIQAENPPVAVFATADGSNTLSVFALNITSLEDYLNGLSANGAANLKNITINGIDCVACENEGQSSDILIVPVTDTMVLVYNCTPLNGDEDWDATKVVIISSIQVAQ